MVEAPAAASAPLRFSVVSVTLKVTPRRISAGGSLTALTSRSAFFRTTTAAARRQLFASSLSETAPASSAQAAR